MTMISETFSIAKTRDQFAALVHNLKHRPVIKVTRRGHPVAVLLSIEEYQRLTESPPHFWEAYQTFRDKTNLESLGIEPEIFGGRELTPGRDIALSL